MNTPTPPTPEQLIAGLKSQIAGLKAALDKALAENIELRQNIPDLASASD
jgi:cell division protein FtsB